MKAIRIPHDRQQPVEIIDVEYGFQKLAEAIGGGCQYIERVNCVLTPEHRLVMVVDEDGLNRGQRQNPRAQWLYPFSPIVGNVLVMAEGDTPEGIDFVDMADPHVALDLVMHEVVL